MGQLQILVERPDTLSSEDFNTALRLGLGEAAHREGVESLVVYLVDDETAAVDAGPFANSFKPALHVAKLIQVLTLALV